MEKQFLQFETSRLKLIPTNLEDAEFILELMSTPKWHQYIGDRKVYNLKQAQEYIQTKMLPLLHQRGFSNYTIILKSTNEKIGSCGLYDREKLEGIDIGFALLPQFENKGYGYEAAQKILEAAEKTFHLDHLSAITTPSNISSQKLLKKLGLIEKQSLQWDDETLLLFEINF